MMIRKYKVKESNIVKLNAFYKKIAEKELKKEVKK
tara:strand:- start:74 stop:178 length:105 start_codon:yes stop_codon:yes gene_type:complete